MRLCTHWDLDGVASEIVLSTFLDFKDTYACGYSKFDKFIGTIKKDEIIIFSDVALTVDQVKKMDTVTQKWYIIDHHPSTSDIEALVPGKVHFNPKHAGVELCRQRMEKRFPEDYQNKWTPELQDLVELSEVYDLWQTDHPRWQEAYNLNLLFWEYGFYKFRDRFKNGYTKTPEDTAKIKKKLDEKRKMILDAERHEVGEKIFFAFCDREVVNDFTLIYKDKYDLYFLVSAAHGRWELGVRQRRDDKNLTEILQNLAKDSALVTSAGGHPKAGGVTFVEDIEIDQITEICKWIADEYYSTESHDDVPF